jgi:iron complex transport system substrate-binding protein
MSARLLAVAAALLVVLTGSFASSGPAANASPAAATPVESKPVLPVRVRDAAGRTVTVRDVRRIVPLNGDLAETVWTLGLGRNIVGVDTSATYPASLARLAKIGYQRSLSAEGILSLQPTVVVGSEAAGPPEVIEQLRGAGVTVLIVPELEAIDAGPRKLRLLGRALGVPRRGERLARQVEAQIALARQEAGDTSSRPRVLFLYLRGDTVQLVAGRGSRSNSLIMAAGGIDAGAEVGINGYQPITAEALVAAAPEVIVCLSAGLASVGGVDGLLRIPGVVQTPAGRSRRVLAYDDQWLLGLGPRTGSALRLLVRDLHPEAARG